MSANPNAGASHGHGSDQSLYLFVFGMLVAFTILTVTISYVDIGDVLGVPQFGRAANIVAGLLVAAIKTSFVVWIFMHMNHETNLNRFVLFFALCLLGVFFLAASCDFVWLGTYADSFAKGAVGL